MDEERRAMELEDYRMQLQESLTHQEVLGTRIEELEASFRTLALVVEQKSLSTQELQTAKSQCAELTKENSTLRAKVSTLEKELKLTREECKQLREKADFLSAETAAYQQTNSQPKLRNPDTSGLREKVKKAEQVIEELKKEKVRWQGQAQDRILAIRTSNSLKQQLEEAKSEIEELKTRLHTISEPKIRLIFSISNFVSTARIKAKSIAMDSLRRCWILSTQAAAMEKSALIKEKIEEMKLRHRNLFSAVLRMTKAKDGKSLNLAHCGVPSEWVSMLFSCLAESKGVKELDLSQNRIGEVVVPFLISLNAASRCLHRLNLANISLSVGAASELLSGLSQSTSLLSLDISGAPINPSDLGKFVLSSPSLQFLGISDISLQRSEDIQTLTEALVSSKVWGLNISRNPIPSVMLAPMLSLFGNKAWVKMNLSDLDLGDSHLDLMLTLFRSSPGLEELGLANTHMSASCYEQMCKALQQSSLLKSIDLSGSLVRVTSICALLSTCSTLLELHAKDIQFSEEEYAQLGQAVALATQLQVCFTDAPSFNS